MEHNILTYKLEDFAIINKNDLFVFASYNIFSVEQLLGATKGLTQNSIFNQIESSKEKIKLLKSFVGEVFLTQFSSYNDNFNTGVVF